MKVGTCRIREILHMKKYIFWIGYLVFVIVLIVLGARVVGHVNADYFQYTTDTDEHTNANKYTDTDSGTDGTGNCKNTNMDRFRK